MQKIKKVMLAISMVIVGFSCLGPPELLAQAVGGTAVRPGAPGEPSRIVTAEEIRTEQEYTEADVDFVSGMMHHHAQALILAAMVPSRATHEAVLALAHRIQISQMDEIRTLAKWLSDRGEEVPEIPGLAVPVGPSPAGAVDHSAHAGHAGEGHESMPGMLPPERLARLEASSGAEFDRLFVEAMIYHHQGALTMISDLLSQRGAGQEEGVFILASEIESDQTLEIIRMERLLATFDAVR